jgi:hypothetical protein
MRYYKIFPLEKKPFLNIDLWANSLEELQKMGLENDPLIVAEDMLPSKQFGVYSHKIEDGVLVAIDVVAMSDFESEAIELTKKKDLNALRLELKKIWDERNFTVAINEDTTELDSLFKTKLSDYNNLKTEQ